MDSATSFEREQAAQKRGYLLSILLGILFVLLLFVLYTGIGLHPLLRAVGLEYVLTTRGQKINCALAEYREYAACQPKTSRADHDWKQLHKSGGGKGAVFSLSK